MTMGGPPFYVGDARVYPHCDLFFLRGEPGKWQALVFNTIGLSRCPPGQFDAIDVEAADIFARAIPAPGPAVSRSVSKKALPGSGKASDLARSEGLEPPTF
jgi:hypothetical protein